MATKISHFAGGNCLAFLDEETSIYTDVYKTISWAVSQKTRRSVLAYDEYAEIFEYVQIEDSWVGEKRTDWISIHYGSSSIYCDPNQYLLGWTMDDWMTNASLKLAKDFKVGDGIVIKARGTHESRIGSIIKDNKHKKSLEKVTEVKHVHYPMDTYCLAIDDTQLLVMNDAMALTEQK